MFFSRYNVRAYLLVKLKLEERKGTKQFVMFLSIGFIKKKPSCDEASSGARGAPAPPPF